MHNKDQSVSQSVSLFDSIQTGTW